MLPDDRHCVLLYQPIAQLCGAICRSLQRRLQINGKGMRELGGQHLLANSIQWMVRVKTIIYKKEAGTCRSRPSTDDGEALARNGVGLSTSSRALRSKFLLSLPYCLTTTLSVMLLSNGGCMRRSRRRRDRCSSSGLRCTWGDICWPQGQLSPCPVLIPSPSRTLACCCPEGSLQNQVSDATTSH